MSSREPAPWVTTSTVLQRLKSFDDQDAWQQFVRRFQRPIEAYARKRGLSESDAEDAAQEALAAFAQSFRDGGYERERGRLSRWLFGIVHHRIEQQRDRMARRAPADSVAWSQLEDQQSPDGVWTEIWERSMLEQCVAAARDELHGTTRRVFEMLVLEGRSVEDAMSETGLSRNAVYIAKHRALTRVRGLLADCDEVD